MEEIIPLNQFREEYCRIKYAKISFAFFISAAKNSTQMNAATCSLCQHIGIQAPVVYTAKIFLPNINKVGTS